MTPVAGEADLTAPEGALPALDLQDAEVVILVIRPSGWFVVLTAWPVLVMAALVAVAEGLLYALSGNGPGRQMVLLVCLAVGAGRLMIGCFQWSGLLYVLTNRRALRFRGLARPGPLSIALKAVVGTHLTAPRMERMVGVAGLVFNSSEPRQRAPFWTHIARAGEIKQIVDETIRQAGGGRAVEDQ